MIVEAGTLTIWLNQQEYLHFKGIDFKTEVMRLRIKQINVDWNSASEEVEHYRFKDIEDSNAYGIFLFLEKSGLIKVLKEIILLTGLKVNIYFLESLV